MSRILGGYSIDNDPWLYVFNVAEKRYFRVARHDTSWATVANSRQVTHPHPSFTPDDSAILFSSDKDGKPTHLYREITRAPVNAERLIHATLLSVTGLALLHGGLFLSLLFPP